MPRRSTHGSRTRSAPSTSRTRHAACGLLRWMGPHPSGGGPRDRVGHRDPDLRVLRWAADEGVAIEVTCVEADPFCRRRSGGTSRSSFLSRGSVLATGRRAAPEGGTRWSSWTGHEDAAYVGSLARRGVVFVEGGRENQRVIFETALPGRRWARACFFSAAVVWRATQSRLHLPVRRADAERLWFCGRGRVGPASLPGEVAVASCGEAGPASGGPLTEVVGAGGAPEGGAPPPPGRRNLLALPCPTFVFPLLIAAPCRPAYRGRPRLR